MRKRKVFRETVITVIVIAFEEKSYGLIALKLWFAICKTMVSLFQNYELGSKVSQVNKYQLACL